MININAVDEYTMSLKKDTSSESFETVSTADDSTPSTACGAEGHPKLSLEEKEKLIGERQNDLHNALIASQQEVIDITKEEKRAMIASLTADEEQLKKLDATIKRRRAAVKVLDEKLEPVVCVLESREKKINQLYKCETILFF